MRYNPPHCFFATVDALLFSVPRVSQDLAQVKTPPNVRMISTSPSELAWMLAGVVYPSDADENPDVYVSDFQTAVRGRTLLTELQIKARNARAMAARFIPVSYTHLTLPTILLV